MIKYDEFAIAVFSELLFKPDELAVSDPARWYKCHITQTVVVHCVEHKSSSLVINVDSVVATFSECLSDVCLFIWCEEMLVPWEVFEPEVIDVVVEEVTL